MDVPQALELPRPQSGLAGAVAAWRAILGALAFRGGCYAAMTAAAVWNELRPAPTLPDLVLGHVPYVARIANANYLLWLAVYVPLSAGLLLASARRFVRYTVSAGLVSLVRGATLLATGLGAPDPARAGPGIGGRDPVAAFFSLLSPWEVFAKDSMAAYLTKDLFFSGHTATTFLLLLYLWPHRRLRWPALAGHALVVLSVFLSHLHYTIDVLGAYAVAFALFVLREGWPPRSPEAGVVRSRPWCVLKASPIQRVQVPPRKEPERLVAGPSRRERSRLAERGVASHYGGSKSAGRNMK